MSAPGKLSYRLESAAPGGEWRVLTGFWGAVQEQSPGPNPNEPAASPLASRAFRILKIQPYA